MIENGNKKPAIGLTVVCFPLVSNMIAGWGTLVMHLQIHKWQSLTSARIMYNLFHVAISVITAYFFLTSFLSKIPPSSCYTSVYFAAFWLGFSCKSKCAEIGTRVTDFYCILSLCCEDCSANCDAMTHWQAALVVMGRYGILPLNFYSLNQNLQLESAGDNAWLIFDA